MSTGTVFDIQRFSVHDGPGIRTTVFLKGCPLRCAWCQNPEGLDRGIRVWLFDSLCAGCGRCVTVCPHGALRSGSGGGPEIDQERCTSCGKCIDACNRNALALDGFEIGADELAEKLLADRVFFNASGGGVTFSGGEPLMQAEFVARVAERLKATGIATAIETSLEAEWKAVALVLPVIDYFQVDVKLADTVRHLAATGRGNKRILDNFRRLAAALQCDGSRLRVRVPLVPGFTADPENLCAVAEIVAGAGGAVPVELLNYNPLAGAKYRRMPERRFPLSDARAFSDDEMAALRAILAERVTVL